MFRWAGQLKSYVHVGSMAFCITAVATMAAGCRVSSDTNARLSGTVTLDDQPIANGSISFLPVDGNTATAGTRIENGKFEIMMPPGSKRVEITGIEVVGQKPAYEGDKNSPLVDITRDIVPSRYNTKSELLVDVDSGEANQDFRLVSK
ncbi:hypothetical protein [Bremerella alba]|uniref:Lipoprotein n=1 Tax=Bremerella alba TaxID=980252 RepID=A0A7V8VA95_9BACT|nr:hypothetical protein [Bremerella alba]MBA2117839.1 hypothetical protein [Bremerella alba]